MDETVQVQPDQTQRPAILEYRRRKDDFFRTHRQSPIPPEARAAFEGLRYYPDDPEMAFNLPLEPDPELQEVVMQTSSGSERLYERLGWVGLPVDGEVLRLAVYALHGQQPVDQLFVPFRDATSGTETYGSGRYIEADFDGETVRLDLNRAYNPNCAYSQGWNCPIPPLENWLSVPIRAGELAYEVHP